MAHYLQRFMLGRRRCVPLTWSYLRVGVFSSFGTRVDRRYVS